MKLLILVRPQLIQKNDIWVILSAPLPIGGDFGGWIVQIFLEFRPPVMRFRRRHSRAFLQRSLFLSLSPGELEKEWNAEENSECEMNRAGTRQEAHSH